MIGSDTPSGGKVTTIYAALEVSGTSWILAVGDPSDTSRSGMHRLAPHDVDGMLAKLWQARGRAVAASGGEVRVMLVYEAGYEGFWLARRLERENLEVLVCDPASLEVVRRKRKAKTDRIDARRMVRALRAWDGGDLDAMSPVRIPTVGEEDRKRLLRRRERLVKERLRLVNAVAGLLRLHGIAPGDPGRPDFRERLDGMETGYGTALPPRLLAEIRGILDRLDPVRGELKAVEAEKAAALEESGKAFDSLAGKVGGEADRAGPDPAPGKAHLAAVLFQLRGIGANDALLLESELLYREFRNRRQLASMAGLAPVPFASGSVDRDQGISKAGSAMLRKHLVQMAWRWLRHQPDSALSAWFRNHVSARDGRSRKRGIVALARRLLVALWRFATTGLVPEGAVLSKTRT